MKKLFTSCLFVALSCLLFSSAFAQQKRIYIGLDDHTDYEYALTEEEHRQIFLETLDYYMNLADQTANLPTEHQSRWNCDGTFWLWTYQHNKSAAEFDRLMNYVRSGHISTIINSLVSTYGAQPSEAVLRGMYYPGSLERRYGVRFPLAVAMENATMPYGLGALWAGAGVKYSWRGACGCASRVHGFEHPDIYWWKAFDGSQLLMKWNNFYVYDGASIGDYQECRFPDRALNTVETNANFQQNWPWKTIGIFGKGGDDNKTLTDDFVNFARNNSNAERKIIVSNEVDFFQDFEANYGSQIPTDSTSFGNEWDVLCTSMAEVSARVKRSVEQLRNAEALQTLVSLKNPNFMRDQITERDQAWMDLGVYWEHDWTADGYLQNQRAAWQRKIANRITGYVDKIQLQSSDALATMIPANPDYKRFYAFNSLSWTRTDYIDFPYSENAPVYVVDLTTGLETPSQLITLNNQTYLRVLASDIPSVGYKVFELRPGIGNTFSEAASVNGNVIENAFYRLTIAERGAVTSLIDKTRGDQEFAREINGRFINDLGNSGGSFEIENAGAVSVTIKTIANSPVAHTTRITLYRDSDRIDFRNEITQNPGDNLYTWGYGFNLENPDTMHEEVGSIIRAKTKENGGQYINRGSRYDWLTMNHFADMTGNNGTGVTLSNADCYFMQLGNSSLGELDTTTPSLNPFVGGQIDGPRLGIPRHDGDTYFLQRFALRTHNEYDAAAAMRFSMEHQNPLVARLITGSNPTYPETNFSLLSISDPKVMLWSLKPAEEGINQGIIARVYNVNDQASSSSMQLSNSIRQANRTTHIETNIDSAFVSDGALQMTLNNQQYQTYRLLTNEIIDSIPPEVSIVAPTNGATFSSQSVIRIDAMAKDSDGSVSKVEFYQGATKLGESTAAPYSLSLNSLPVGKYNVTARAIDNRGFARNSSTIKLQVANAVADSVSVSAANYRRVFLARGSIATAFGTSMATTSQAATTLPLSTNLIGTSITIIDSLGRQRSAPLFYVSPTQINYQIPENIALGTARIQISSPGQPAKKEYIQIVNNAPGLFTAQADGQGIASAQITRVKADGTRSDEGIVQYNSSTNSFSAIPIDLGNANDRVFLILYGTGLRGRNLNAAARIGNQNISIDYIGAQGTYVGLDQVNIQLPRSLAGAGEVEVNLTEQGLNANPVKIRFK
jgi:alpha-mannosidase